ncbi:hypothetical protein E0K54_14580 [Escherichia coli]|nr:hypothetical protein E0K54_14580 [Escherichia coli]
MPTSPVDCHFKTFIAKSDISCLHKTKPAVASSDKRNPRECEDCYSPLTASCRLAITAPPVSIPPDQSGWHRYLWILLRL